MVKERESNCFWEGTALRRGQYEIRSLETLPLSGFAAMPRIKALLSLCFQNLETEFPNLLNYLLD